MCTDCYLAEIEYFDSEQQFLDFDLDLLKKIHNARTMERMADTSEFYFQKVNKFKGRIDSSIVVETYRCRSCNSNWHLSAPNFPWKGFLKQASV